MEHVCETIAEKMIRSGLIEADKREWMVYILQKWVMKGLGVGLFLVLLGLLAGWWNALAFFVVFSKLRGHAGGWHAPKPWICFVLSTAIALAVGFGGPAVARWPLWVHGAATALSAAVLVVIAPVAPASLPFTPAERAAHRRTMFGWLGFAVAAFALACVFSWKEGAVYIAMALICVCLTVVLAKIGQRPADPSPDTQKDAFS